MSNRGSVSTDLLLISITISMKLPLSKIASIGVLVLIGIKGYSQKGIRISGTLDDSLTQEPIRFATVALFKQQANTPVRRCQTDSSGHFVLNDVPGGMFTLRMTYVGYNDVF